tara:strand:+ start:5747 stop:5911 length:165 start_codon:yes stop_codon:yes gene_type:complete
MQICVEIPCIPNAANKGEPSGESLLALPCYMLIDKNTSGKKAIAYHFIILPKNL